MVLTVTDNQGATGTQTQAVTVAANVPPTASFTATPTKLSVAFDGDRFERQRRHDRVVLVGLR